MAKLPEQIVFDRTNDLRKELDGKIDKKIDKQTFFWILGILISILVLVFSANFHYTSKVDDASKQINERLIRLESILEKTK